MTTPSKKFDHAVTVTWVIGLIGALFTIGALVNIFRKPTYVEATSVMNLSQFERPSELGMSVFKRYWVEINEHPIVVLGISAEFQKYQNYLEGFIASATKNKFHFDSVYSESGVQAPNDAGPVQIFEPSAVLRDVKEHKKVLVLLVTTDERLERLHKDLPDAFIVAQSRLPQGEAEIKLAKSACPDSPLACQSIDATRAGKIRNPKENQTTAAILHEEQYEVVFVR